MPVEGAQTSQAHACPSIDKAKYEILVEDAGVIFNWHTTTMTSDKDEDDQLDSAVKILYLAHRNLAKVTFNSFIGLARLVQTLSEIAEVMEFDAGLQKFLTVAENHIC